MQIKNYGIPPALNSPSHKDEKDKNTGTQSFGTYLQNRMNKSEPQVGAVGGVSVDSLCEMNGIEAIATRSRIHQNQGGDVSDYLELIQKKEYLLRGVDFSSQAPLNEASSGGKTLSAEQAAMLREKYNVDDLPSKAQYGLFQKLTDLGIITKYDVQKTQLSVAPDKDDLMGYIAEQPEFSDVAAVPETKPKDRLDSMIHNERFAYNHVLNRYGKRCQAVAELVDSHQKVLDTLNQI